MASSESEMSKSLLLCLKCHKILCTTNEPGAGFSKVLIAGHDSQIYFDHIERCFPGKQWSGYRDTVAIEYKLK